MGRVARSRSLFTLSMGPLAKKDPSLIAAIEPNTHFTRLVTRFDVHDTRTAAYGAVFDVLLRLSAAHVDKHIVRFAAEGARHLLGGTLSRLRCAGHCDKTSGATLRSLLE